MRQHSVPYIAVLAALLFFALVLAALSLDVMARVWAWRARFEHPLDIALLLYMEGVRSIVALAGIGIALIAAQCGTRSAAALAIGIAFATIAYTKLMTFGGFPGAVQEQLAIWLRMRGVTRGVMQVVFGYPEWRSGWLAQVSCVSPRSTRGG